jgi:hypothetical protein
MVHAIKESRITPSVLAGMPQKIKNNLAKLINTIAKKLLFFLL